MRILLLQDCQSSVVYSTVIDVIEKFVDYIVVCGAEHRRSIFLFGLNVVVYNAIIFKNYFRPILLLEGFVKILFIIFEPL
jgi:hypothetical protein